MTTTNEHPLIVGDVLESSWGYEQTNVDFYQVTRATPKTVVLRPISARREQGQAWGTYAATPEIGQFTGDASRYKVRMMGEEPYVMIKSFAIAKPWKGAQVHGTNYA